MIHLPATVGRLRRLALCAIATTGLFSSAAFAEGAALQHWETLTDKSAIEWTAIYGGKPIVGTFKHFTSEIVFDPEHLDQSSVVVRIDVAKVASDDKDAEQSLPTAEWFDAVKFPEAIFEAKTFRHIADEKYEAEGTLTIGEKKNALILPFSVHFYDDKESVPPARFAQMTAETSLKRTEYGVGKGEWSKTETVADDVKVTINLKAKEILPATTPVP